MVGLRSVHNNVDSRDNPNNLSESRQRLHRVRGVFLALLEGDETYLRKNEIQCMRRARKDLENIAGDENIHSMKSSKEIKDIIKKASKDVLHILDIDHSDASTKSLHTLATRYKSQKMTAEKFLTRFENGKIYRDIRFIIYVLHFYGQQGYDGIKTTLKISKLGARAHTQLRHKSPATEALASIFDRIRVFADDPNSSIDQAYSDDLYEYGKKIAKLYKEPKNKQK